nr:MAG TPA: hypothetical protein [Caudoviricetes sp.]
MLIAVSAPLESTRYVITISPCCTTALLKM